MGGRIRRIRSSQFTHTTHTHRVEARVAYSGDVMIFSTMGEMRSRERGMLALSLPPSFIPFSSGGDPSPWNSITLFKAGCFSPIKPFWKHLHSRDQRCVSRELLNSVKLAMTANHHSQGLETSMRSMCVPMST